MAKNLTFDKLPTGKIDYTLTNDYMFKAVLQEDKKALKSLLSALLNIPLNEIKETEIINPIILGEHIEEKTCVLDINLKLNNNSIINLEMQVRPYDDWKERSLTYLCKNFDNLNSGDNYGDVLPAMQIGILDFNLPDLEPYLYSEYRVANVRNHEIYSGKIGLFVLNLNVLEDEFLTTKWIDENDTENAKDILHWARIFKAQTWEDIKMLAKENEYMEDCVVTLAKLSEDEKIRMECEAREKYERDIRSLKAANYKKGYNEGYNGGYNEGYDSGRNSTISKQIKQNLESGKKLEDVVEFLGISLEEAKELIKE